MCLFVVVMYTHRALTITKLGGLEFAFVDFCCARKFNVQEQVSWIDFSTLCVCARVYTNIVLTYKCVRRERDGGGGGDGE